MHVVYEDLKKTNAPFQKKLMKAAEKVLNSGWYVMDDSVTDFEKKFSAFHRREFCVSVASGLDALKLSLVCADFPEGSEVIVPSNAYIADVLAIQHAGMRPVLVEPDPLRYNLDPKNIEAALTSKTVAILAIHLYGKPADMPEILKIATKHNLLVLEDCAQAHGAKINSEQVGNFGDLGAFSFYPTKNLGGFGDGGAVVTNNKSLAERLRALRDYGSIEKNVHAYIGYNSRLDAMQAALLSVKLEGLDAINAHKQKLAKIYHSELPDSVIKPHLDSNVEDVFHIYAIRHPERDRLKAALLEKGVQTAIHYPTPVFEQPVFKGYFSGDYPIAREIHNTVLSLPISYGHTEQEILYVCQCLKEVLA